jgi:hypothetical protein
MGPSGFRQEERADGIARTGMLLAVGMNERDAIVHEVIAGYRGDPADLALERGAGDRRPTGVAAAVDVDRAAAFRKGRQNRAACRKPRTAVVPSWFSPTGAEGGTTVTSTDATDRQVTFLMSATTAVRSPLLRIALVVARTGP